MRQGHSDDAAKATQWRQTGREQRQPRCVCFKEDNGKMKAGVVIERQDPGVQTDRKQSTMKMKTFQNKMKS